MKRRNFLSLVSVTALGLTLAGQGCATQPATVQSETTLLVSAAASLQDVLGKVQPGFEAAHPTITIAYNFGSSGALQQQIEQGAPADVFISAGIPQMDALEEKDLLKPGSRQDLLSNQLVLIVPKDSTLGLTRFNDLDKNIAERISVGEFRTVPAGQYTEQVFSNLGLLEKISPRLVFANNVRGVLAAVESGNVDAGVVYATDAALSRQVTQVAVAPENLHDPIIYPLAIMNSSPHPEAARTFVDYLSSDAAQAVFKEFGFTSLD
ncbi:MAG: molybdate ABC transporter substrate-binding protein [Leptolyngbyaceae cyanobacterium SM2_3_12]|nr:molybdate ABC transporter substrate-binding protein [Leptolyngbyaceae cyanobacterium SM2_3_12]